MLKLSLFKVILVGILSSTFFSIQAAPRWYSPAQVEQGEKVFLQNCAVCHGTKAEKSENWKTTDANGNYPPPPLNGTAHAWHHSLDVLRRSVREGGTKIGGQMPAFEHILSPQERDSAIAFFQSQWTDELYEKWRINFKVPSLEPSKTLNNDPLVQKLLKRLNNPNIDSIERLSDGNFYLVMVDGNPIILTPDGRYAVIGDVIDLNSGNKIYKP